jgi:glycosyltransferase involved in cell wall biosynthesis
MSGPSHLVSIVIPTKDRSTLLMQTIESIRRQTFDEWEALVIDDASSDDTPARMAEITREDPRIRFHVLPPPRTGAPAGRNLGVELARGEYLIFLDSDDLLAPHCLEQRVAAMNANPQLDFAVFPCQLFRNEPGDEQLLWNADTDEDDLDRFLRMDIPWQTTSPIWRRSALANVGPWDEQALAAQDWELHIRALVAGLRYKKLEHPDCYWRRPDAQRYSIGKSSRHNAEYLRSREPLIARMLELLVQRDLLTPPRKQMFVGMYFQAAERLADGFSRREARRVWRICRRRGLIPLRPYLQGLAYLLAHRWPGRAKRIRERIEQTWPPLYLCRRSSTYLRTPLKMAEVAT